MLMNFNKFDRKREKLQTLVTENGMERWFVMDTAQGRVRRHGRLSFVWWQFWRDLPITHFKPNAVRELAEQKSQDQFYGAVKVFEDTTPFSFGSFVLLCLKLVLQRRLSLPAGCHELCVRFDQCCLRTVSSWSDAESGSRWTGREL